MGPHLPSCFCRACNESEDVEQHDNDATAQRDASTEVWSMVSTSRAAKRGRSVSLEFYYFIKRIGKVACSFLAVLIFVFHFER